MKRVLRTIRFFLLGCLMTMIVGSLLAPAARAGFFPREVLDLWENKSPDVAMGLHHGWTYQYDEIAPDGELAAPQTSSDKWEPWNWQNPDDTGRANGLWLKATLPDAPYPDKSLLMANIQCDAVMVFLNGAEIYQSGSFSQRWNAQRPVTRMHLIPLPDEVRELQILFYSARPEAFPLEEPVLLYASQSKLMQHLLAGSWIGQSFGYLFLFVGVYALFAHLLRRRYGLSFSPWFAFMAICLGVSQLISSNVMFMFSGPAEWFYHAGLLGILLFPVGLWRFVELSLGSGWMGLIRRCWQLQLIVVAIIWPSHFFGWMPFWSTGQLIGNSAIALQLMVGAGEGVRHIRGHKGAKRIIAAALLILSASGLFDIATHLLSISPGAELYPLGMLALIIVLAWVQERAAGEAQMQLRAQTDVLKQHQQKLEQTVEERTKELRLAMNDAEAASVAKSRFLANMSHELRTPLNAILGYAQLFQRDRKLPEDRKDQAGIIRKSGEHLLMLINDILDIAKIEAGKTSIQAEDVLLRPLIKNVADMIAPRARAKDLVFDIDTSDSIPDAVVSDEKRLRQLLLNLLSNAVKFTEKGSVRLSAWQEDGKLVFCVTDTGIGIARKQLEAVFDPFHQVAPVGEQPSTGLSQNEGTGLGLAISRSIAREMGGDILVQSRPGQGSLFRLELPCIPADAETVKSSVSAAPLRAINASYRLLVADDRPENRTILRDMLTPMGFDVMEAKNGREAVEIAGEWMPDLILMDLLMPEMNGFEAVQLLKSDPVLAGIPVVAVSASVYDQTQTESLCAGCVGFLPKPVNLDALITILGERLDLGWDKNDAPLQSDVAAVAPSPLPEAFYPLREAAIIGDVQEVLREAGKLKDRFPEHAGFISRIHELASAFEILALQRLLDAISEESHVH